MKHLNIERPQTTFLSAATTYTDVNGLGSIMFASNISPSVEISEKLIVVLRRNSLLGLGWGGSWGLLLSLGSSLHGGSLLLNWFDLGGDLLLDGWFEAELSSLAVDSLLLALSVLGSAGITLGIDFVVTNLLSLELVNGLHKDVLVLELVTLGTEVQLVVDVLVDLLGVTVLLEESTENASSAHGEDLNGHTGLAGSLSVTSSLMATLALLGLVSLNAGARVHGDLTSHDKAILEEFSDVLACYKKLAGNS